jgi:hypothetical protein
MYEDVPPHLRHPLWTWTSQYLNTGTRGGSGFKRIRDVANHMRYDFAHANSTAPYSGMSPEYNMAEYIERRSAANAEEHLQIVEFLLANTANEASAAALEELLRLGNSAYAVSTDGKRLEMRVAPEIKTQVEDVIAGAVGSAGDHLTNAWNEAYGREQDPVKSYSESIKAAEAALAPVVTPNDLKATLGTMIGQVRSNPHVYQFVIAGGANSDGVQTVLDLMRLLWEGQTSRHAGVNPTRHETQEEAQAAVHIAASLVQFGSSGAFSRR